MHESVSADDVTAEGGAHALVTEADAQQGDTSGEVSDSGDGDTGLIGGTGSGRYDDVVRVEGFDLIQRDLIVAHDADFLTQFSEVLDEVIGKGVVVIDHEEHRRYPNPFSAISTAFIMPRALLRVSWYSLAATESATIPAPA